MAVHNHSVRRCTDRKSIAHVPCTSPGSRTRGPQSISLSATLSPSSPARSIRTGLTPPPHRTTRTTSHSASCCPRGRAQYQPASGRRRSACSDLENRCGDVTVRQLESLVVVFHADHPTTPRSRGQAGAHIAHPSSSSSPSSIPRVRQRCPTSSGLSLATHRDQRGWIDVEDLRYPQQRFEGHIDVAGL